MSSVAENRAAEQPSRACARLDLFSTSRTSDHREPTCAPQRCINDAPHLAWQSSEKGYAVVQGNCHDWNCPRCGIERAKHEYGRMVEGARSLAEAGHSLYFLTLTCRGREMTRAEAEAGFLQWTDKFLAAVRMKSRRNGQHFAYAGVTERQKRGHPHSHYLTTWEPGDLQEGFKTDWKHRHGLLVADRVPALRSGWIQAQVIRSGLGDQYDISRVRDTEAASRYVAKYLFKPAALQTAWPKGWRRVRYSQNWPKLDDPETDAFALIRDSDWERLAILATVVTPHDEQSANLCRLLLPRYGDVLIRGQGRAASGTD